MNADALEAAGLAGIAYLKPKVVITAPDGTKLWIDPLAAVSTAPGTGGPSLWPSGLSASIATGDAPPESATDTSSVPAFAGRQAVVILNAPGPLGVSYAVWLGVAAFALAIGIVAYKKGRRKAV